MPESESQRFIRQLARSQHGVVSRCQLLGGGVSQGLIKHWLARALNAPRDPMWVSDGVASNRWVPVSPVTGEIVPCEWKVPFDSPQGQISFADLPSNTVTALLESKTPAAPASITPPRADDPGIAERDDD